MKSEAVVPKSLQNYLEKEFATAIKKFVAIQCVIRAQNLADSEPITRSIPRAQYLEIEQIRTKALKLWGSSYVSAGMKSQNITEVRFREAVWEAIRNKKADP
jgi:hypothetical protein